MALTLEKLMEFKRVLEANERPNQAPVRLTAKEWLELQLIVGQLMENIFNAKQPQSRRQAPRRRA
jgi:hypothetical protein